MSPERRRGKLAYLAFITVCLVWGTTYLAITVALETVPVLLVAGLRWMAAGVVMSALMLATGRGLPRPAMWGPLLLLGFLMNVVGNGFVVYAQQYVASGLTAVLIATTPFWSALVERLLPNGERFSKRALFGLSLGFTGIVILVWPEMTNGGASGRAFVLGVIAIQLACVGWVIGTLVREAARARRQPVSLDGAADGVQRDDAADGGDDQWRLAAPVVHAEDDRGDGVSEHRGIARWRIRPTSTRFSTCRSRWCRCTPTSIRSSRSRLGTLLLSEPFSTRVSPSRLRSCWRAPG